MENKYIEVVNRLARIEAIKIEVEGMKVANSERQNMGHAFAYDEKLFNDAAREINDLAEELLTFRD